MNLDPKHTPLWLELLEQRDALTKDEFQRACEALEPYPVARRLLQIVVQVIKKPHGEAAQNARVARIAMTRVMAAASDFRQNGMSLNLLKHLLSAR